MTTMPAARRIDFHIHLIPQFYQDAAYAAGAGPAIGRYPEWSPERALELMDASGIEVALTSLAQPGVQFGDPAEAGVELGRELLLQREKPRVLRRRYDLLEALAQLGVAHDRGEPGRKIVRQDLGGATHVTPHRLRSRV